MQQRKILNGTGKASQEYASANAVASTEKLFLEVSSSKKIFKTLETD